MCAQVTERKMDYSCLSMALIQILIVIKCLYHSSSGSSAPCTDICAIQRESPGTVPRADL